MTRTDFQDSYDEDRESKLSSSTQLSLPVGINKLKRTKKNQLEKKAIDSNDDDSQKKEEDKNYSTEIRTNNRRYEDQSNIKLSREEKRTDVYTFNEEISQSEDDLKKKDSKRRKAASSRDTNDISVGSFFLDASLNENDSNTDNIRTMTPAYRHTESTDNIPSKFVRKNTSSRSTTHSSSRSLTKVVNEEETELFNISSSEEVGIGKRNKRDLQKHKESIQGGSNSSKTNKQTATNKLLTSSQKNSYNVKNRIAKNSNKKKTISNEVYITENENQDSMHQDTDYGDMDSNDGPINKLFSQSPEGNSSKDATRRRKPGQKRKQTRTLWHDRNDNSTDDDEWLDDDQENFLYTLREQPIQEMTEKPDIQWAMFSKRLSELGTYKTPAECQKQV